MEKWTDYLAEQERHRAIREDLMRDQLLRRALLQGSLPRRGPRRVWGRLGELLVTWGTRLQGQAGSINAGGVQTGASPCP